MRVRASMFGIADCAKDADTIYSVNVQMGMNLYVIFTCAKDADTIYYAW